MPTKNSFGAAASLRVGDRNYQIFRLAKLDEAGVGNVSRLPFSTKILLENLLRHEDGRKVLGCRRRVRSSRRGRLRRQRDQLHAGARAAAGFHRRAGYRRSRRHARRSGGAGRRSRAGQSAAAGRSRHRSLRAGGSISAPRTHSPSTRCSNFSATASATCCSAGARRRSRISAWFRRIPASCTRSISNISRRVVFRKQTEQGWSAYPDTLVGTDSHTTMVNGLGVLGWGVGGIEAEACMLGQPVSMLLPPVVGFKLHGKLREGCTATDLVLTVTQMLRKKGVVGKFVEFYGSGLECVEPRRPRHRRQHGARVRRHHGLLPRRRRNAALSPLHQPSAGPGRAGRSVCERAGPVPHRRTRPIRSSPTRSNSISPPSCPRWPGPSARRTASTCPEVKGNFQAAFPSAPQAESRHPDERREAPSIESGAVVIAAITSCTNTSNPSVMVGAGLLAKKAVERGLKSKPWVKTSLAPGSKVVTDYLDEAGLMPYLEQLNFHLVGYGCTTCIGNSGPLPEPVAAGGAEGKPGGRGRAQRQSQLRRPHQLAGQGQLSRLAAAGGCLRARRPRRYRSAKRTARARTRSGEPVYLRDIWPTTAEIEETIGQLHPSRDVPP